MKTWLYVCEVDERAVCDFCGCTGPAFASGVASVCEMCAENAATELRAQGRQPNDSETPHAKR